MKNKKIFIFVSLLFVTLSALFFHAQVSLAQNSDEDLKPQIIVKYKDGTNTISQVFTNRKNGKSLGTKLSFANSYVIKADKENVNDLVTRFSKESNVEYAEVDNVRYALSVPNDPKWKNQWGLQKIQANIAWDKSKGNPAIKIGVVDTGIDKNHPDLASKIDKVLDALSGNGADGFGHGTHVAGIAAAATNNSLGIAGTAYNTRIISVKALNNQGQGHDSGLAKGIRMAVDNGANVINMSWGGPQNSRTILEAIQYAQSKGVILVAAAGNDGSRDKFYPAGFPGVVSVAATTPQDRLASFSNRGSWVTIAAPGVDILSTLPNNKYEAWPGTSMASPFVAGSVALIKAAFPSYSNSQIIDKLCSTSDHIGGEGSNQKCGRVNLAKALFAATPTPTPPGGGTGTGTSTPPPGGGTGTGTGTPPPGGGTGTGTPTGTPTKQPQCDDKGCKNYKEGNNWAIIDCYTPDPDGDIQLCSKAGRVGHCGGKTFCCPAPGQKWTSDMSQCGGGTGTPTPGTPTPGTPTPTGQPTPTPTTPPGEVTPYCEIKMEPYIIHKPKELTANITNIATGYEVEKVTFDILEGGKNHIFLDSKIDTEAPYTTKVIKIISPVSRKKPIPISYGIQASVYLKGVVTPVCKGNAFVQPKFEFDCKGKNEDDCVIVRPIQF